MVAIKNYNSNWIPGIFEDFIDNAWMGKTNATAPAINVIENKNQYLIELAAPGMSKEDFKIHIDDSDNLVIQMEHLAKEQEEDKEKKYLRREFNYSKFSQTLILPEGINKKAISAKVENGVLYITLPKLTPEEKQETLQQISVE